MSTTPKSLPARAAEFIRKHKLISAGDHILAAVSGGPDSVALLALLINIKDMFGIERITVGHFDHRLRGDESDADREFVRGLADSAGLDFRCGAENVRDFAGGRKISVEMAARECRRFFFIRTAAELNADKIALGHTTDDQAEEVILRILRGTGPSGIQGMPPMTAERIIRPLLSVTRDSVIEYLRECGLGFRNDSTNLIPSCQRNFIRLKVFPLLREAFHPQIAQTITRCADLSREEESWWTSQIRNVWDDVCLESLPGLCTFDSDRLRRLHPALLRRVIRLAIDRVKGDLSGVGLVHVEPIIELVFSGKSGKSVRIPGGVQAEHREGKLRIEAGERAVSKDSLEETLRVCEAGNYVFGEFGFEFRFLDETGRCEPNSGAESICMDSGNLKWPLELRFRRAGDRFHPLGMTGSKKLQDFFTDCKIPRAERQKIPLLCDGEKICWVAGMRLDDRVKVNVHTRQILMVRILRDSKIKVGD